LRQADVARVARLSQATVSLVERGHIASLSLKTIRAVFRAVDAGFEAHVTWRGGELDRVIDEVHAALVAETARLLIASGWDVSAEVTYSQYGERGSIDLLATRRPSSVAVVIEVKTTVLSVEETLRRLDAKVRLAPSIVFDREGWRPSTVARLLVISDVSTQRRRIARHETVFRSALPERNVAVRRWIREPVGPLRGLIFLSPSNRGSAKAGSTLRTRARRPKTASPTRATVG
jgi:transcriptional regulator with XRE-family HTH domain